MINSVYNIFSSFFVDFIFLVQKKSVIWQPCNIAKVILDLCGTRQKYENKYYKSLIWQQQITHKNFDFQILKNCLNCLTLYLI